MVRQLVDLSAPYMQAWRLQAWKRRKSELFTGMHRRRTG